MRTLKRRNPIPDILKPLKPAVPGPAPAPAPITPRHPLTPEQLAALAEEIWNTPLPVTTTTGSYGDVLLVADPAGGNDWTAVGNLPVQATSPTLVSPQHGTPVSGQQLTNVPAVTPASAPAQTMSQQAIKNYVEQTVNAHVNQNGDSFEPSPPAGWLEAMAEAQPIELGQPDPTTESSNPFNLSHVESTPRLPDHRVLNDWGQAWEWDEGLFRHGQVKMPLPGRVTSYSFPQSGINFVTIQAPIENTVAGDIVYLHPSTACFVKDKPASVDGSKIVQGVVTAELTTILIL